jgi:two-component system, chemotaxis family, CheB/CheR fusion protein
MAITNRETPLDTLLDFLRMTRGFDFSGYKRSSLERRIAKRMEEVGVADYGGYVEYLELRPDEYAALFNTILINVTSFFRDPATWQFLAEDVLPQLLEATGDERQIRIWCAGCSSGQETYTMAIVLAEALGLPAYLERVKIYATDVDEHALNEARHASYPARAVDGVAPALRDRYFERAEQHYGVRKDLRRTVIFGRNDLVQDAPISRIDLLSCRNTLMYFNAETQGRILRRFNFALNPAGFLFLGKSEMLITHADLFRPLDLRRRVFAKVGRGTLRERLLNATPTHDLNAAGHAAGDPVRDRAIEASVVPQLVLDADEVVVLANQQARALFGLELGDVGQPFSDLELSSGPVDLRSAVELAHGEHRVIVLPDVAVTSPSGDAHQLEVHVSPLQAADRTLGTAIAFLDVTLQRGQQLELDTVKRSLETAYEELQSTVEELETTNEELQSTNEELETTNEELQSTNEELETMNEELQSTNEELETMNDEMRIRALELDEVNAFLETILTNLGVAVVVVDANLVIRVWNAASTDLWGLRAEEVEGRNLLGLDFGFPVDRLGDPLRAVLGRDERRVELREEALNRLGRFVQVQAVCLPLFLGDGTLSGAIVLMDEVSEGSAPAT